MQRQNQIEQIEYGKSGRDSEREGDRGEGEVEREREEGRKQQRTIKIADKLHTRRQGEGRANPDTPTATQLGRGKGGYMPRPPLPSPVSSPPLLLVVQPAHLANAFSYNNFWQTTAKMLRGLGQQHDSAWWSAP